MSTWAREELDRIGLASELQIASPRADGSLRPACTNWTVRAGEDTCVRPA